MAMMPITRTAATARMMIWVTFGSGRDGELRTGGLRPVGRR
jgi:hypothetical protein